MFETSDLFLVFCFAFLIPPFIKVFNSRTLFFISYYFAGVQPTHLYDIARKALNEHPQNSSINEFAVVENIKKKLSKEALTVFQDLHRQLCKTEVRGVFSVLNVECFALYI